MYRRIVPHSRFRRAALLFGLLLTAAVAGGGRAATPPRLLVPYDIESRGSALYIADGERHQLLRYDLKTKRMAVFAGTGKTGTSGDGGRAVRARLTEPTEIVIDSRRNVYFTDVNQGRVRRVGRNGVITTIARIPAAAGLSLDPTGRYIAVASIIGWVYRVELATGKLERIAGDGTSASSGDGGPASAAQLNGPHSVAYDAAGNLFIAEPGGTGPRRIDAVNGVITTAFTRPAGKVVAGPNGSFYLLNGDPNGGTVTQIDSAGSILRTIGTGKLTRHRDRVAINRIGFSPTDVEPVGSAIFISQTKPVPAIRRLAQGGRTLTTVVRG